MVGVVTTAGAIVWAVAATLGVVGNIERFIENLGFDAFTFDGGAMLRALVIGGLIASLAASVTAAVLTVMFNLLSDLTGGIEAVIVPARPRRARRRRKNRSVSAEADESGDDAAVIDLTGDPDPVQAAIDDILREES
jgi:hypothetical protein